jgi:hypothetical protein
LEVRQAWQHEYFVKQNHEPEQKRKRRLKRDKTASEEDRANRHTAQISILA